MIIKDGNVVCPQIECTLENDKIHSYFNRKARNSYETSDKEKPSWMIDYEPLETLFLEEFEIEEDLLKQILKCLPNTASGFDNLTYADLKRHLSLITPSLKTIFTICGRNNRVLSDWKIALIILILKTNGNKSNLDDWRPISLLLTMYKVFMKIIQRKILPWIVSEKRLCATQKGSLHTNGLQEHVFSIRAIIEDFKNSSGKLYVYFMDITDAFGSIPHDLMISELRDAGYPEWLCSLTKEIYTGSSFRIRTKNGLSDVVVRRKGIIQGDPWSVILFEQGIDRWLRGIQSLATEETNPTGFGYVDDLNMRSNNKKTGDEILSRTADFLDFTGMQVKHRKCAILQGKRSGVNWKELNNREVVETSIQGSYIPVLPQNKLKE